MKQIVILRPKTWKANSENLYSKLKGLDKDKDIKVEISEYSEDAQRNNEQNAYMHAIIGIIEKHRVKSGLPNWGAPILKLYLKSIYFGIKITKTGIGDIQTVKSTKNLSIKGFAEFTEFIRKFAYDEYGEFYVMTPNEWRQYKSQKETF